MMSQSGYTGYNNNNNRELNFITEGVWLGSARALQAGLLKSLGVNHVLNCAMELPNQERARWAELEGANISCMHVPWDDSMDQRIYPSREVDTAVEWIDKIRASGQQVLVNCQMGISRSSAMVIAYLILRLGYDFDSALNLVQRKRPIANPNPGFVEQLRQAQPGGASNNIGTPRPPPSPMKNSMASSSGSASVLRSRSPSPAPSMVRSQSPSPAASVVRALPAPSGASSVSRGQIPLLSQVPYSQLAQMSQVGYFSPLAPAPVEMRHMGQAATVVAQVPAPMGPTMTQRTMPQVPYLPHAATVTHPQVPPRPPMVHPMMANYMRAAPYSPVVAGVLKAQVLPQFTMNPQAYRQAMMMSPAMRMFSTPAYNAFHPHRHVPQYVW